MVNHGKLHDFVQCVPRIYYFEISYGSKVIRFDSRCYDRIGILIYAGRTPGQTLSDAFFLAPCCVAPSLDRCLYSLSRSVEISEHEAQKHETKNILVRCWRVIRDHQICTPIFFFFYSFLAKSLSYYLRDYRAGDGEWK